MTRLVKYCLAVLGGLGGMVLLSTVPDSVPRADSLSPVPLGDSNAFRSAYREWTAAQAKSGSQEVVIPLGWSKALSREHTRASGLARLDYREGQVSVEVRGLEEDVSDVWLVDNQSHATDTVAPEPHDRYLQIGRLHRRGDLAVLRARPGPIAFADFDVDLVVVTRNGERPAGGGILFGTPTLFQRLDRQAERERLGLSVSLPAPHGETGPVEGLFHRFLLSLAPGPVQANHDESPLVAQGRNLFFNERFAGNGRTCGTCHPTSNNLTIDPTFIASLPARDPLFVAEFIPALAVGFENPKLMRGVGLILENLDGFNKPGVMRGVPHTFALRVALNPAPFDGTTIPPVQRTGWSGDGAPNSGSLRDFATGAVTQHFPLTLRRVNGSDFRLPNDAQLDAMEAFQLSLGRQAELDLNLVRLRDPVAALGLRIFNNGGAAPDNSIGRGQCFACHDNAGANADGTNFNANFNTGVEALPAQPADLIDAAGNPPDGGFGGAVNPAGGFGDGTFNTPVLVEAADTGPFFHSNTIETIEEAVNFYNSDAFNNSPSGQFLGGINLAATEVRAVAAFLRSINAVENIRLATRENNRAKTAHTLTAARVHINQALEEIGDALEVLRCGRLNPRAIGLLLDAFGLNQKAANTSDATFRNSLLATANSRMSSARGDIQQ